MKRHSIRNLRLLGGAEPARKPVMNPGRDRPAADPSASDVRSDSGLLRLGWKGMLGRFRLPQRRHLFLVAGYGAYCALLLLIFFILTFPYGSLQRWMIHELEKATDASIAVDRFERIYPLGIAWWNVSILHAPDQKRPVELDLVQGRLYLIPLLQGKIEVDTLVEGYGGRLRGGLSLERQGESMRFYTQQTAQEVDLGSLPLGLPFKLRGVAGLNLEAQWLDRGVVRGQASSTVELRAAELSSMVFNGIEIPDLAFSRVLARMTLENGVVKIEDFRAQGSQMEASGSGTFVPRNRPEDGLLNLSIQARVKDEFQRQFPMIGMLGDRMDAIQVTVKGTLRKPLVSVNGMPINL